MVQSTTRAFLPRAETFRDNPPLDEPVRSLSPNYLPLVTDLENLIDVGGTSETRLFASLTENHYERLVPNDLSLVTALENLIDVVGTSEARLFASLTENHYERLVVILNGLIDVVRENEDHLLASLMDFIGTLIEHYEDEHVPELSEI